MQFGGTLVLKFLEGQHTADGRAEWEQTGSLILRDVDDAHNHIIFPLGARTDLGSIPQFAWSLGFPPDGIGDPAYVIHDLLYRTHGTCELGGPLMRFRSRPEPYTRAEADEILRRALIVCGVPGWRARVIWAAVRLGGGSGWGR
jgi:hypothetical protein